MQGRTRRLGVLLTATLTLAACYGFPGDDGDSNTAGGTAPLCTPGLHSVGPSPVRRLTQSEYDNTVRDLLGDTTHPAQTFPPDQVVGVFSNNANALTVPPLLALSYAQAAEALTATALKTKATLVPCDLAKGDDGCAKSFIATFGKKAYRRTLAQAESDALFTIFTTNKTGTGATFTDGITAVMETILQSAPFLYRAEYGDATKREANAVVPLTSNEMASRLSYFLWGSMPDDALLAAADKGELATAEQIADQAKRMLADPKAKDAIHEFYEQWLGIHGLDNANKDTAIYPLMSGALRASMTAETDAFVDWVMWGSDHRVETLLTAPLSFLDANTAKVYGVAAPTGTGPQLVNLDPQQRAGVLTQPSVLATLAKPNQSSPVLRGRFVREHFLCQPVNPPPADVNNTPPPVTPGTTTRQRMAQHTKDPKCASCHSQMDPIGFGLENYDGIGAFRTTDQGLPVDSSGELLNTDVNGKFVGGVELAKKLGQSALVRDCLATQWFRYGIGRAETKEDSCAIGTAKDALSTTNGDLMQLLIVITQSDTFRFRSEVKP
ncbi:DUF1588 domain-containing protein [soil metagenome]